MKPGTLSTALGASAVIALLLPSPQRGPGQRRSGGDAARARVRRRGRGSPLPISVRPR